MFVDFCSGWNKLSIAHSLVYMTIVEAENLRLNMCGVVPTVKIRVDCRQLSKTVQQKKNTTQASIVQDPIVCRTR